MGTPSYNSDLAQQRAQKVADYFQGHGIELYRLKVISYGEHQQLAGLGGDPQDEVNRRVELHLLDAQGKPLQYPLWFDE